MQVTISFKIAALLFLVLLGHSAFAADLEPATAIVKADVLESQLPDSSVVRASGNVLIQYGERWLRADIAEGNVATGEVKAEGNLLFGSEFGKMSAESIEYSFGTGIGRLRKARAEGSGILFRGSEIAVEKEKYIVLNAAATTCSLEKPHFLLGATQITVVPGDVAIAKKAYFQIGGFKMFSLPTIRISLNEERESEIPIPVPGYSSRDGFFLRLSKDLIVSKKTYATAQLRPTTAKGVQGRFDYEYLLIGRPSDKQLEQRIVEVDRDLRFIGFGPAGSRRLKTMPSPHSYELRWYCSLQQQERCYDYKNENLRLSRHPEIGLKWLYGVTGVFPQPIEALSAQAKLSFGRYKEYPGSIEGNRWDARILGAARIAQIGEPTSVRMVGLIRFSQYQGRKTYRVFGAGLDISHAFSDSIGATFRFINHKESGSTPYEFDNLDIKREFGVAIRRATPNTTQSLILRYDIDRQKLYDWQVTLSKVHHCLEPSITWRKQFNELQFNIRLVGLQERSY